MASSINLGTKTFSFICNGSYFRATRQGNPIQYTNNLLDFCPQDFIDASRIYARDPIVEKTNILEVAQILCVLAKDFASPLVLYLRQNHRLYEDIVLRQLNNILRCSHTTVTREDYPIVKLSSYDSLVYHRPENVSYRVPSLYSEDERVFTEKNWIASLDDFTEGLLRDITWNNVILAGGSLSLAISAKLRSWETDQDFKYSDIDLFVYGNDQLNTVNRLIRELRSKNECVVFSRGKVFTILVRNKKRNIQIVAGGYETPEDVIESFDFSHSKVYFNGASIKADYSYVKSQMHQCTEFCKDKVVVYRIAKYARLGLSFNFGDSVQKPIIKDITRVSEEYPEVKGYLHKYIRATDEDEDRLLFLVKRIFSEEYVLVEGEVKSTEGSQDWTDDYANDPQDFEYSSAPCGCPSSVHFIRDSSQRVLRIRLDNVTVRRVALEDTTPTLQCSLTSEQTQILRKAILGCVSNPVDVDRFFRTNCCYVKFPSSIMVGKRKLSEIQGSFAADISVIAYLAQSYVGGPWYGVFRLSSIKLI